MNVGIDLINLRGLNLGMGRYARQLVDGLTTIDRINQCLIFVSELIFNEFHVEDPRFHKVVVKSSRRVIVPMNQLYFALGRHARNLDFVHSPVGTSPFFCGTRTVLTVHDLAFEAFPDHYSKMAKLYWRVALRRACRRARIVLTVSESTKRDLLKFVDIPEEKIAVVSPCVSLVHPKASPEDLVAMRDRYCLPENYVLHVGVPHPRKNLANLVRAFKIAKRETGLPHKIVLAGSGWNVESLVAEISGMGMVDEVIFTGPIPEHDLPLLYNAADMLVFPSLYEGFGYPPLEAMACRTPVIVSNNSSLPEVVGEAALLVDPLDPRDIADKILRLLLEPDLADEMRDLGLNRVQHFSKERMAAGLSEAYDKVMSDRDG